MTEPLGPVEAPPQLRERGAAMLTGAPVDVLVVGAGPVGLALAHLLAAAGVRVLVVERNRASGDLPRAVSIDDESMRIMQGVGLDTTLRPIVVPGTGTKYFGGDGRPIAYARGSRVLRLGHPVKNPFQQPQLERFLVESLAERPRPACCSTPNSWISARTRTGPPHG